MSDTARQVRAVTLIVTRETADRGLEFLLIYNENWKAFTLPISKIHEDEGEDKEKAVWRIATASKELGFKSLIQKPQYLDHVAVKQLSQREKQITEYTYQMFHLALPAGFSTPDFENNADNLKKETKGVWVTLHQIIGSQYVMGLNISPTVMPILYSPGVIANFIRMPDQTVFIKSVCDGLVEVVKHGLYVLGVQRDARGVTVVDKSDTLVFDNEAQNALFNKARDIANTISAKHVFI